MCDSRRRHTDAPLLAVFTGLLASALPLAAQAPPASEPAWQVFQVDELVERRTESAQPWLQFLRVPDLFAGIHELAAGESDMQTPHAADEVYHVLAGRATLVVAGERAEVRPGTIVYVRKDVEHRFEDVLEELTVLVFFATPPGD